MKWNTQTHKVLRYKLKEFKFKENNDANFMNKKGRKMSDLFYFFKGIIHLTIFILHKIGKFFCFLLFPLVPFLYLYSHYKADDVHEVITNFDAIDFLIYAIGFFLFMVYLLFFFQLNFYYAEYLPNHATLSSLWTFWVEPSITVRKLGLAIGLIVLHIQTYLILFLFAKELFRRTVFAYFVKLGCI